MANKRRGFGSLDEDRKREIARKGGKTAHERGTAHEFSSEEAALAGQKGGKSVSKDRSWMAEIGRRGGLARAKRKAEAEKRRQDGGSEKGAGKDTDTKE